MGRAGDGDHAADGSEAVIDIGAGHRRPVEDGCGKTFELAAVEVAVGAEHARGFARRLVKDVDVAALEIPGVIGLAEHAAVLAVDLETFVPVHAYRHGQVEMAEGAAGEADVDEPAPGAEAMAEPRLDLDDLAAEEPRDIEEMAAMGEHVILLEVGLRIDGRAPRRLRADDFRLHRVGHGVAMSGVTVPGL